MYFVGLKSPPFYCTNWWDLLMWKKFEGYLCCRILDIYKHSVEQLKMLAKFFPSQWWSLRQKFFIICEPLVFRRETCCCGWMRPVWTVWPTPRPWPPSRPPSASAASPWSSWRSVPSSSQRSFMSGIVRWSLNYLSYSWIIGSSEIPLLSIPVSEKEETFGIELVKNLIELFVRGQRPALGRPILFRVGCFGRNFLDSCNIPKLSSFTGGTERAGASPLWVSSIIKQKICIKPRAVEDL